MTIKRGNLQRLFLNLAHIESNTITEWSDALSNIYYICQFTIDDNHGGGDIHELLTLLNFVMGVQDRVQDAFDAYDSDDDADADEDLLAKHTKEVELHQLEMTLRNSLIPPIRHTIEIVDATATVIESA